MRRKLGPLLSAIAGLSMLTLVACGDEPHPAAPIDPDPSLHLEVNAHLEGEEDPLDLHIVIFDATDAVPADLSDRVAALGGTIDASFPELGIATIAGIDDEAAAQLQESDDVQMVERDFMIDLDSLPEEPEAAEIADITPESPGNPAGASRYSWQWNLRAIGADRAWAAGHLGSRDVTVAILDTGIDYGHPDLQGLVDLSRSRSFVRGDDRAVQRRFPDRHPVTDLHYHGTHVAATVSSNARVAAGVTSQVTLIGVKVLSRRGSGRMSNILKGIVHAADVDADVINMSLGSNRDYRTLRSALAVTNRAISYAYSRGSLVVVSAGNSRKDLDADKSGYKRFCDSITVVCVSSTGPSSSGGRNGPWEDVDSKSWFTNYGRTAIDVAAPGGGRGRGGAVWAACSQTSLRYRVCQTGNYILGLRGTSMASPHAAAVAGLLVEQLGSDRPGTIKAALGQTADDLGERGVDPIYGKGRVNAAQAVGLE